MKLSKLVGDETAQLLCRALQCLMFFKPLAAHPLLLSPNVILGSDAVPKLPRDPEAEDYLQSLAGLRVCSAKRF